MYFTWVSSHSKLYTELGLESLQSRRRLRCLCVLHKIVSNALPTYLCKSIKSVQIWSFFWSVISCIWTEYGYLRSKSPYSVRIQENTDQKNLLIWTLFDQWIPKKSHQYITRNGNDIATYQYGTNCCLQILFLWTITKWKKIDIKIPSFSYSVFRRYLLKEIGPKIM